MNPKPVPPAQVTLAYRVVGEAKTHVFTSNEVPGLHVGSSCLERAFEEAIIALGELVSYQVGYPVTYKPETAFEQFALRLEERDVPASLISKYVIARREEGRA